MATIQELTTTETVTDDDGNTYSLFKIAITGAQAEDFITALCEKYGWDGEGDPMTFVRDQQIKEWESEVRSFKSGENIREAVKTAEENFTYPETFIT